jgi:radical SAM superfamily enzyme YgiQ (UPF0313 family)
LKIAVVDALARGFGSRYATFDVVGAGPRHVAGVAEKHGETVLLPYEKAVTNVTRLREFDVVMISAMSGDFGALSRLTSRLRKSGFKGNIVVGGPISFEYTKLLLALDIDYVIVGEGEIPVDKLLQKLAERSPDLASVPALAYKNSEGAVKLTSSHLYTPREVLALLEPWVRVDEAYENPQVYRFYVEVVRGCSNFYRPLLKHGGYMCIECHNCRSAVLTKRLGCPAGIPPGCGFCSVPYMFGYPRSRPIKSIVREVEGLLAHGARRIVLSAPDFLDYMREELVESLILTDPCNPPPNVDAIEELLNALYSLEYLRSGRAVLMIENIKACLVNESVGKVLGRYLKGTTVHIGLETGCDWFNERVLGKPIYLSHVLSACRILRESGLRPYVYLMYDLPFASEEVYVCTKKAVDKLREVGVEKITLYKFVNLPATAFENIRPETVDRKVLSELKSLVNRYNTAMKRRLLGDKLEVYLVESRGKLYGYPVKHGPVVFIKSRPESASRLDGCRALVKVVDIESRFVRGVITEVLEC